jgi:hypothetical protein
MLPANFEMLAFLRVNRDLWNATSFLAAAKIKHSMQLQYTDIGPVIIIVGHRIAVITTLC